MEDHDQRLKTLFQLFFSEFFETFFPPWSERLDFTQAEWLDKEVFADPPAGRRRTLDLLARVPIRCPHLVRPGDPNEYLALSHLEIDSSERTTTTKKQLWENFAHLRAKHGLPVLPVAIFLKVGLEGVGQDEYVETFGDLQVLRFRYLCVGLPRLNALEYLNAKSLLAVALTPFMAMEQSQAIEIGGQALERIANAELDEQRKFLLAECVEAYLPLSPEQQLLFEQLQTAPSSYGVKAMNLTTREKAFKEGVSVGRYEGKAEGRTENLLSNVCKLLDKKFGPLTNELITKLSTLEFDELDNLFTRALDAKTLAEALG